MSVRGLTCSWRGHGARCGMPAAYVTGGMTFCLAHGSPDMHRVAPPGPDLATEVERLRAQKDGAYYERNRCVAALARMALALGWKAGVGQHPAEDTAWEDDWRTIIFIDLPTGQASWHFHDSERHLLAGLPAYGGRWDGHNTEEKYDRLHEVLR